MLKKQLRKLLHFIFTGKRKEGEKEPNCYIVDCDNKTFNFEYLTPESKSIPIGSHEREYKGRMIHFLSRDKDNKLNIIDAPRSIEGTVSPKELFNALTTPGILVERIFGLTDSVWDKISLVALYVLIGAFVVFIFLIWGTSLG